MTDSLPPVRNGRCNAALPLKPSSQEREAHREYLAGCVFTLLEDYFVDEKPEHLIAAQGKFWVDVLEPLSSDLVYQACIEYARDEPRKKPTPGAIYLRALALMRKPLEPQSRPCTREEADAYLAAVDRERINPERAAQSQAILAELMPRLLVRPDR